MRTLNKIAIATATISMLSLGTLSAHAADGDMSRQLTEARQEGSVWTAFALNRHLSPFAIDVDIEHGVATLTGRWSPMSNVIWPSRSRWVWKG